MCCAVQGLHNIALQAISNSGAKASKILIPFAAQKNGKILIPFFDGESNPGLHRDRVEY